MPSLSMENVSFIVKLDMRRYDQHRRCDFLIVLFVQSARFGLFGLRLRLLRLFELLLQQVQCSKGFSRPWPFGRIALCQALTKRSPAPESSQQ